MKPSPPNKPLPILLLKWIANFVPFAAPGQQGVETKIETVSLDVCTNRYVTRKNN